MPLGIDGTALSPKGTKGAKSYRKLNTRTKSRNPNRGDDDHCLLLIYYLSSPPFFQGAQGGLDSSTLPPHFILTTIQFGRLGREAVTEPASCMAERGFQPWSLPASRQMP